MVMGVEAAGDSDISAKREEVHLPWGACSQMFQSLIRNHLQPPADLV